MPKSEDTKTMNSVDTKIPNTARTFESTAYLKGVFSVFQDQRSKYCQLTGELLSLEAQTELAEKTLCLARDHFAVMVEKTQDALPNDWTAVLDSVRYVGIRLADACSKSLQEHKKMTPEELLRDLNNGMFRFRTNSPLREIHAALMRHPHVKREKGSYVWVAPPNAEQITMRLKVAQREWVVPEQKESETKELAIAEKVG